MNAVEEVLMAISGCEQHDHYAQRLDITMSKWREIANETIHPPICFSEHCDNGECDRYRKALQVKPGDEPGSLFGTPVLLIADQPQIQVVHGETSA